MPVFVLLTAAGFDYLAVDDVIIFEPSQQVMEYDLEFFDDETVEVGVETFSVMLDLVPDLNTVDDLTLGITMATIFIRDINSMFLNVRVMKCKCIKSIH